MARLSRFAIPAFTPMLLNLAMIAASLWLLEYFDPPIYALAVGVMAGGILQLGMQWLALLRLGIAPRASLRLSRALRDPHVRPRTRKRGAATAGVAAGHIHLPSNTDMCRWLPAGSR